MTDSAGPPILYVEDEPLILELGVTALEEAGFTVTAVPQGLDAVSVLDRPDCDIRAIVTDIDLGGKIDGWQVAKHARERFPEMPIVYVSGGSSNDWASMGVPGSVMLVKPYASAQLVVAVSSAMQGTIPQP